MKRSSFLLAFALAAVAAPAMGQDKPLDKQTAVEADAHFKRAVQLYGEANYRAALIEFKRAYELAPRVSVLYNIGQTYQQLQEYAAALRTFERYMAEGSGPHASEVETAINVLKTRVGRIDVSTEGRSCELTVDDEAAGKTPLSESILVSVGRHRITATCSGIAPVSRAADVAAGETLPVSFTFSEAPPVATPPAHEAPSAAQSRVPYATYAWISLGAAVAFGAGGTVAYLMGASDHSSITDAPNYGAQGQVVGITEQRANDLRQSGLTKKTVGVVLWGVGGAALATSIVLFTLKGKESTTTVGFAPGVGGGAATLSGRF